MAGDAAQLGPGSTSPTLLSKVQAAQSEAWRHFVALYSPLIYYWCRRAGLSPEDAADTAQETLLAVARNIKSFSTVDGSGTLRGWLRTITLNKVKDHFRRAARLVRPRGGSQFSQLLDQLPDCDDKELPEGVDVTETAVLIRSAVNRVKAEFEPRTWVAFWQTAVEGEAAAHVSDSLDMTVGAVYKAKSRVLSRLRQELHSDLCSQVDTS